MRHFYVFFVIFVPVKVPSLLLSRIEGSRVHRKKRTHETIKGYKRQHHPTTTFFQQEMRSVWKRKSLLHVGILFEFLLKNRKEREKLRKKNWESATFTALLLLLFLCWQVFVVAFVPFSVLYECIRTNGST